MAASNLFANWAPLPQFSPIPRNYEPDIPDPVGDNGYVFQGQSWFEQCEYDGKPEAFRKRLEAEEARMIAAEAAEAAAAAALASKTAEEMEQEKRRKAKKAEKRRKEKEHREEKERKAQQAARVREALRARHAAPNKPAARQVGVV